MRRAIEALVSGCVVYAVVAACSSADTKPKAMGTGGSAANGGANDASGAGGGMGGAGGTDIPDSSFDALVDALADAADALTDPVPDAKAGGYESGSRLRARYLAGTDGSKHFNGWWDSQRNEACSFLQGADGLHRCMPSFTSAAVVFTNSTCTSAVTYHPTTPSSCGAVSSVPKYVLPYQYLCAAGAAFLAYTVFTTGGQVPTPSEFYTKEQYTGVCKPSTNPVGSSTQYAFYSLTEVPYSEFVSATQQTE